RAGRPPGGSGRCRSRVGFSRQNRTLQIGSPGIIRKRQRLSCAPIQSQESVMRIAFAALAAVTLVAAPALAQAPQHVELKNNAGEPIGHAMIVDPPNGVLMHVEVKGLTPG